MSNEKKMKDSCVRGNDRGRDGNDRKR